METKYYIAVGGQQQGPYTLEELSGMEIYADTLVWKSGMPNWEPAGSIEELTCIVRIQAATPQPPAPMGDVVPTVQRSFLRRHRGWFIALGILVLLCGVMALTNPGKKAHTDAINEMLKESITREMGEKFGSKYAENAVGSVLALTEKYTGQLITVHNYGLFSVGEMNIDGKGKTVSVGIFGHVFTMSSSIDEYIKKQVPLAELDGAKQELGESVDSALNEVAEEANALLSSLDTIDIERALQDALTELDNLGKGMGDNVSVSEEPKEDGEHPMTDAEEL